MRETSHKWTECEKAAEIYSQLLQLSVELGGKLGCDSWERAILEVDKDGNGLEDLDCKELYDRIHALWYSFEQTRKDAEEETPAGKICADIQSQIAECCPEVSREDTEYQPISREEYQHRITEQLKEGHDPKGIYFREKGKMEEKLSRYWEVSSYDDFDVRAACHERSDFDDAFIVAVYEYEIMNQTGKKLEDVGAIIANGGNGGRRIFPESDLDYQFALKQDTDGFGEREYSIIKQKAERVMSDLFSVRMTTIPDKKTAQVNAEFATLLQQSKRIDKPGVAFNYVVGKVEHIVREHQLLIPLAEEDKKQRFYEFLVRNYGITPSNLPKQELYCALEEKGITLLSQLLEKGGLQKLMDEMRSTNIIQASCTRNIEIKLFEQVKALEEQEQPDPRYADNFKEFFQKYQKFQMIREYPFDDQKDLLEKMLSLSVKEAVTTIRENMVARYVDGDPAAAESYFARFRSFVSENQEAAMVVTGAQLHPINQFLHLPRLNVKEALYRPIQAAIINILIAQSKIHHGDLEELFSDLKDQGMLTDETEERLRKGLQAIDYLRISLAEYQCLLPQERGGDTCLKPERKIFSPDFIEWIFQEKPKIGEVLAEAQTALAGIAPIYKEQHRERREYGMSTELGGGFALREGNLDFSSEEEPDPQKYIFDFFEHLSRTGGEPTDSAMHFLYRSIDAKCVSDDPELCHQFKNHVFDNWIRQKHFAEAARVLSRTRLLRMLFPEYAKIVSKPSPGKYYLQGDEMLANLLYLREDVAENPECRAIWEDVKTTGKVKVLRLAILLRNSADAQAAFDKIDPEKRIISQTEREEIAFLIEHQGCLFPPSSKEKREAAMKGRNGHMQLDIASSGERVNPFEHKRFAEIMDGNESLASAVIALNASQKIAINPVCPDKERILTAATHFYQEHKYREYLENAIKHNADFFWSLVESVLAKIDEKTRKKYITGLQQSPGIIVSRMINALIAEKRYPLGESDIGTLSDIIPLLDSETLVAECSALDEKKEDTISYSVVRENGEQKTATVSFCTPRTSASLKNMGIAFSNNECSIEQATTFPIDDENMIITAHVRYTGKADKSQIRTGIGAFVKRDSETIEKTKKSPSFSEYPEITINTDENAIEIITFGEVIPAYTFADIMGIFAEMKITPDHFVLTTKETMKYRTNAKPIIAPAGIHDKFFFSTDTIIPEDIKEKISAALSKPQTADHSKDQ